MLRLMPSCSRSLPPRVFHFSTRNAPLPYAETLRKIIEFKRNTYDPSTAFDQRYWRTLGMDEKWEKEMQPYQNALSSVVEETIATYNPELTSVIEIGSGKFPITQFLSNHPKKEEIHFSDYNVSCLHELKKNYPKNTIRQVNILSPRQTALTYQTVVMNDVLNSFSEDEVGKALISVNKLLKPGGHLIHFSMREPIFVDVLDCLKKAQASYLPIVDQHNLWHGVYVINRKVLVDYIFALKSDLMRDILCKYMALGPYVQDFFCAEYLGTSDLQIFSDLSKSIEKNPCLVEQKIVFEERYRQNLVKQFVKHNYHLLEFREKEGNYSGPAIEERYWGPKANTFFAKQMVRLHSFDPTLPPGQVKEQAIIHVLVAQKPFVDK